MFYNGGFEGGSISENEKILLETSKADLLCFLPHPLKITLAKVLLTAKIAASRQWPCALIKAVKLP